MRELEKPVEEFSKAMIKKLEKNNHKGSWRDIKEAYLLHLLINEVEELYEASYNGKSKEEVRDECVDVANFAMMIFDNCKEE